MQTNPNIEQIVNYLLEAPKIMREVAAVQWQYLDGPPDGSMFLVWQPPEMQTNFPSDGYIWPDAEAPFNSEVRGYVRRSSSEVFCLADQDSLYKCCGTARATNPTSRLSRLTAGNDIDWFRTTR